MIEPSDEQLDALFDAIPEERASERFTAQVIARLQGRTFLQVGATRGPVVLVAAAVAALVVVGAAVVSSLRSASQIDELRNELTVLAAENRAIVHQLNTLQREARSRTRFRSPEDQPVEFFIDPGFLERGRESLWDEAVPPTLGLDDRVTDELSILPSFKRGDPI